MLPRASHDVDAAQKSRLNLRCFARACGVRMPSLDAKCAIRGNRPKAHVVTWSEMRRHAGLRAHVTTVQAAVGWLNVSRSCSVAREIPSWPAAGSEAPMRWMSAFWRSGHEAVSGVRPAPVSRFRHSCDLVGVVRRPNDRIDLLRQARKAPSQRIWPQLRIVPTGVRPGLCEPRHHAQEEFDLHEREMRVLGDRVDGGSGVRSVCGFGHGNLPLT